MLRILAVAALLAIAGCNEQRLFTNSGKSATIPGETIAGYAKAKGLSPQAARHAMIADNLTTKGASLPKQVVGP
jgi:hypothetical protein